jgi:hypothetical protein
VSIKYVGGNVENIGARPPRQGSVIPKFSVDQIRSFRSILSFLNEKDRDILYLIFVTRKKQKDVQRIIDRSQPSLCYDIKRIRRRLKFIFYLHSVFDIFLEFISKPQQTILPDEDDFTPLEREILTLMFYTSSFTMTANTLGLTQVKVRYAYDKCVCRMEELEIWEVYEIFTVIRDNLNIVKRVYRDKEGRVYNDIFIPM